MVCSRPEGLLCGGAPASLGYILLSLGPPTPSLFSQLCFCTPFWSLYFSLRCSYLFLCFSPCLCISQSLPLCVFSLLPPLPLCLGLSLFLLLHAPSPFCIIRLARASSQSQPSSRGSSSRRGRRSSPGGSRAGSGVEYRQSQEQP